MPQPIDPTSAADLEAKGLRLGLVDTGDPAAFEAWTRADNRGFHGGELTDERVAQYFAALAYRRTTAVWDEGAPHAASPVATVNSWVAQLSVPGERIVPAWAISSVTVAPTHRRKGIARALLEAELRTAHAQGVPLAILTVSESTIYGRFGFAPGAFVSSLTFDTRRAKWAGPDAPGRVHFVSIEQFRDEVAAMHDRVRRSVPGQIEMWGMRWDEYTGVASDDAERTKALRAVRYDAPDGATTGVAIYRVTGGDDDFSTHTLVVEYLSTETPEAYAALWRYLLEVDLVSQVRAGMRSVDEPVLWQVSDMRAVRTQKADHLWLRILDVKAALEARAYTGSGAFVLEIADELGFAGGRFAVEIADGVATVAVTDAAASLAMSINELSALYLGGVAATTLVAAARITELLPGAAAALDTAFRSARPPHLGLWF
ncbi:MAG: family N-acetyltransferase [Rhodoglobus sp.]|nr:family N-acetyltransferase [Rhodoglobus sp.]